MIIRAFVPVVLALSALRPQPLHAQDAHDAMILFTYWPKAGQEAAFHDGYREHLDWHRANEDAIMWYAWDVIAGKRTGLFIDGAFDIAFSALDRRVKPAEDAADFTKTAAQFAEVNDRVLYRLRTDLSSGTPLESREPGRMVVAASIITAPGTASRFESVLEASKQTVGRIFTTYEVVAGGEQPQYLVLTQHDSWEDLGEGSAANPATWIMRDFTGPTPVVRSIETEIWRYRADLTYFP